MFELTEAHTEFVFGGLAERPHVSLNRGFAAPIILNAGHSDEELAFFAKHETDPFNRWDAMNRLFINAIHAQTRA
ncbi:DUF3458 domain-containing protein, partial [Klebsiella pneumoniae]|uniref:DUF3458 domain-containing protein n=1 Tax=Klebsiella pneumoniae TaxID=573 RepID=UPI003AF51A2A